VARRKPADEGHEELPPKLGNAGRMPGPERREQIVGVARDVFVTSGLAGARTKQVADLAGVTEALVYRYFSSKDELFEAAVLEPLEELVKDFAARTHEFPGLDARSRKRESRAIHAHMLDSMMKVIPLLGVALFADQESGQEFYQERIVPILDQSSEAVAESLRGWPHQKIDPELLFMIMFGVHLGLALDAHFRGQTPDVETIARALTDFLIQALTVK
jgi:AcrR family transcriptional regulator